MSVAADGSSCRERSATRHPASVSAWAMAAPRSGWRGTMTPKSEGICRASRRWTPPMISSSPGWVEAATNTGRRCVASLSARAGAIGRRRLDVELQVARGDDVGAAERREALGVAVGLGEAQIEAFEQRRDGAAQLLPARERALRHAAVDDHHRDPPRRAGQHEVGPQVRLDEQREPGPPVIEDCATKRGES